jgi:hypothetical protein
MDFSGVRKSGAVSYPSGCEAGGCEFKSQLDPALLMLCEDTQLPWWLGVGVSRGLELQKTQKYRQSPAVLST